MKYFVLSLFLFFFAGIIVFQKNYSLQYMVDNSNSNSKTIEFPTFDKNPIAGKYPENNNYKKYVVHFWATWCPTCKTDMPKLIDIIKNNSDSFFYLVSIDSNMIFLNKFIKEINVLPLNLCFIEGEQSLARSFNTYKFPESHIFDERKQYEQKLIGSDIVSYKMLKALSQ